MPGIITLTTDFGMSDPYVAAMKGVILSLAPQATIVDICHTVEARNILAAGYILSAAYPFFSPGTVHVAVVDPGVGTSRRPVAVAARGQHFVGPDNGLFSFLLSGTLAGSIVAVHLTQEAFWLPDVSATFHGRDIFSPVAAHLLNGVALSALGRLLPPSDLVCLEAPRPVPQGDALVGMVVHVDIFGNLITNIAGDSLSDGSAEVIIAGHSISGLSRTYGDRPAGELLALVGSSGYLEIAVASGSAAERLGAGSGTPVHVGRIRGAQ